MPCNVMNDKLWPYNTFQSGKVNKKTNNKNHTHCCVRIDFFIGCFCSDYSDKIVLSEAYEDGPAGTHTWNPRNAAASDVYASQNEGVFFLMFFVSNIIAWSMDKALFFISDKINKLSQYISTNRRKPQKKNGCFNMIYFHLFKKKKPQKMHELRKWN